MEIESLIGQYVFTIIMCLWFMFKTETILKQNTEAISKLNLTLEKHFFKEEK